MGALGSLALAAAGTVLLVAIAHLLKFRADGRFDSVADALARAGMGAKSHGPSALSLDQAVVLVLTSPGRLTLIEAMGDKVVARQLSHADVQPGAAGVAIIAAGGLGRPSRMVRFDTEALTAVLEVAGLAPGLDVLQPAAAS
jgi:hypothetical protein